MQDNKNPSVEKSNNIETPKKRSFFGGSLDIHAKDLLDFRYNTQEEIDKLNEEMTTTSDLDEIIKQTNNITDNEDMNNKNEGDVEQKDEKEEESNFRQIFSYPTYNNTQYENENEKEPIEGEIVEDPYENEENKLENEENEPENEANKSTDDIKESDDEVQNTGNDSQKEDIKIEKENINEENNEEIDNNENIEEDNKENDEESELGDSVKFFDPFELNLDESNEELQEGNDEFFDPFGLNEENDEENDEENNEYNNEEIEKNNIINQESENLIINENNSSEGNNAQDDKNEDENKDNTENTENNVKLENEDEENSKEEIGDESEKNENEEINEIENNEEDKDEETENEDVNIENYEELNELDDSQVNDEEEKDDEKDDNENENIENNVEFENEDEEDNKEEIHDESKKEQKVDNHDEETDEKEENENNEINEDETFINTPIPVNPNQKDRNKETLKDKKIKKNSATGEIITEEEVKLEQGQDMPDTEYDEEYQPTDEEIFEYEPEFFNNDELSQQFLILVQNVRGTFKLERKDGEQNPYFKILGSKTKDSTLEYLFYLIEEEDEPIDLYIKKVETNQEDEDENEHLVQFSYNEDKELNIFVDEIILYEKINKSDPDTLEYNDTKSILEKFIFLTDNYYDKLKSEIDKQHEEKQKKRQLQQIFKGF